MNYIPVLVISNWSIQKIYDFFEDYLNANRNDILTYRIEKYKTHRGELRDSNKTVLIIKRNIYELAIKEKLNVPQARLDFLITEYKPDGNSYPYEGYSSNLFFKIGKNITALEIETIIENSINLFVKIGYIKSESYTLTIPLESRITGDHRGFVICNFNDSVEVPKRVLIKTFLQNITLEEKYKHVQIFWARKRKSF